MFCGQLSIAGADVTATGDGVENIKVFIVFRTAPDLHRHRSVQNINTVS